MSDWLGILVAIKTCHLIKCQTCLFFIPLKCFYRIGFLENYTFTTKETLRYNFRSLQKQAIMQGITEEITIFGSEYTRDAVANGIFEVWKDIYRRVRMTADRSWHTHDRRCWCTSLVEQIPCTSHSHQNIRRALELASSHWLFALQYRLSFLPSVLPIQKFLYGRLIREPLATFHNSTDG